MKTQYLLDTHIAMKYRNVITTTLNSKCQNDPDKLWGTLGIMACQNVASQTIVQNPAA